MLLFRAVPTRVSKRSTKRQPDSLWAPKEPFRQRTAFRMADSASLCRVPDYAE